jgi:Fe-coproporphyrin III synthase
MISISKLYCQTAEQSDNLRYNTDSKKIPSHLLHYAPNKKPVIVWNVTKACNLSCTHCYSGSNAAQDKNELDTDEAKDVIDDLSSFGAPVVLFSGGEPLLRKDIFEIADYAKDKGLRVVFSTNGTLITEDVAERIKKIGVSYVGISIDGKEETNDYFRNGNGIFKNSMNGIKNCQKFGIKVGLRFTIHKGNKNDIPEIFDLLEENKIQRICFYHLVYSGRGLELIGSDLDHREIREALDYIIKRTKEMHNKGNKAEVLTVDNHADGPYLYLKMKQENNPEAENALELLKANKWNNSGIGIGCISWDGEVYPDQFLRNHSLGNVKSKKFSRIWEGHDNPFLQELKNRHPFLPDKCKNCSWLSICNGNFRARAEAFTGDLWGFDPACYLDDEEIFFDI